MQCSSLRGANCEARESVRAVEGIPHSRFAGTSWQRIYDGEYSLTIGQLSISWHFLNFLLCFLKPDTASNLLKLISNESLKRRLVFDIIPKISSRYWLWRMELKIESFQEKVTKVLRLSI